VFKVGEIVLQNAHQCLFEGQDAEVLQADIGGVAGDDAPRRQVPSYVFAGAPRYHSGGIAGLMPGEIPAILQRGEVALPKDAGRTSMPVNVVMNISTPDAGSFRASQAQIAAEAARGIRRAGRNL